MSSAISHGNWVQLVGEVWVTHDPLAQWEFPISNKFTLVSGSEAKMYGLAISEPSDSIKISEPSDSIKILWLDGTFSPGCSSDLDNQFRKLTPLELLALVDEFQFAGESQFGDALGV